MKNQILKRLLAFAIMTAMLFSAAAVQASGTTLKFSTAKESYYVGDTITLNIIAANAPELSGIQFDVRFDPAKVTYAGGTVKRANADGNVEIAILGGTTNTVRVKAYDCLVTSSTIATLTFKAKAVASETAFSMSGILLGDIDNREVDAISQGNHVIAITEPPVLSKNADLKSLTIAPGTLSPAFSSDNTVYATQVSESTANLTVSATAADAKASVSVSGNKNLQPGENTVKVVVTAEDINTTKTYTIKVIRTAATPTPSPSPTPAPTPTPGATVQVNGSTLTIAPLDAGKNPPAGFSPATISLQNQMVPAYVSQSGGMTLLYLKDSAGTGSFYVHDAATGGFAPFRLVTVPAREFVLLPADGVTAPAGFKTAQVTVSGQSAAGFQAEKPGADGSLQTLVYLMDASGIKALYTWSAKTGELSRFVVTEGGPQAATPTPALTSAATGTPAGPTGGSTGSPLPYILAIAGLAALSVVLGAVLLYKQFGGRSRPHSTRLQPPPIRRVD